jgi:hypothetical protein
LETRCNPLGLRKKELKRFRNNDVEGDRHKLLEDEAMIVTLQTFTLKQNLYLKPIGGCMGSLHRLLATKHYMHKKLHC